MTPKSRDQDRDNEARLDELGDDPGQVGSDSAGQSGDSQGLSDIAESAAESVEELADTDQAYEAEAIQGVEDAGDHPERQVPPGQALVQSSVKRPRLGVSALVNASSQATCLLTVSPSMPTRSSRRLL